MSSEEDDDLKALRTAVLSSIRNKSQTQINGSREIYDTDIDDLEALRKAALKTVKPEVNSFTTSYPFNVARFPCPIQQHVAFPQYSMPPAGNAAFHRFPQFRLRPPTARSNLIVIRTAGDVEEHGQQQSFTNNTQVENISRLILPQDRYQALSKNFDAPVTKPKRTDKWSRFDESSSSDEDDEDQDEESAGTPRSNDNSDDDIDRIDVIDEEKQEECNDVTTKVENDSEHSIVDPDSRTASPDEEETSADVFEMEPVKTLQNNSEAPQQFTSQIPDDWDEIYLEEPAETIEFLDDDPRVAIEMAAKLYNHQADLGEGTSTSSKTRETHNIAATNEKRDSVKIGKLNSSKHSERSEKEQLEKELNEVNRKLHDFYKSSGQRKRKQSPISTKDTKRARTSKSKNSNRPDHKRRDSPRPSERNRSSRNNVERQRRSHRSGRPRDTVETGRHSGKVLKLLTDEKKCLVEIMGKDVAKKKIISSVVAVSKTLPMPKSSSVLTSGHHIERKMTTKLDGNNSELRERLTKTVEKVAEKKDNPTKEKDLREKLSRKSLLSMSDAVAESTKKESLAPLTNKGQLVVNNDYDNGGFSRSRNVATKRPITPIKTGEVVRRVIIGEEKSATPIKHRNDRSFIDDVHVQWKKFGAADTSKEGKSVGGKIKLKRP